MVPLITSILDTDLYKLTMQMAVVKKFPYAKVKYNFINRNDTKFPVGFDVMLKEQILYMSTLKLTKAEKLFLKKKCPFFEPAYLDFLEGYRYDPNEIVIDLNEDGKLTIIIEGYWYRTILWEVPLMALISQLYFKLTGQKANDIEDRTTNNYIKANEFINNDVKYADLGTRRRYSHAIQSEVVEDFTNSGGTFVGTSNVYFAYIYDVKPIGTQAHEWFSFHGSKYGYKLANKMAMEHWVDVYRGNLGIALTDTYTTDNFYHNFDTKFAKLYDGVRHDSGDPYEFLKKTIDHYEKLGIDPMTKSIIFSDSLNTTKAIAINKACKGKINCSFGIGTHFTNDVGVKPLNMVIKLMEVLPENGEWVHSIKLSDDKGKHTGNKEEIKMAKYMLNID